MENAAAQRLYGLLHEERPYHDGTFTSWAEKPSKSHPYNFTDGVTVWVAPVDLTPKDKFLTDPNAPGTTRGGEDLGDQD